jgi:hypothetical protein
VENRRGGRLGDGNEGAALERGWARQTARGGRKRSAGGRWLGFKGSGGEGAEEWMPRGGRAEEREGERGGPGRGVEQRGDVSSTRAGGALPRDSGGRRGWHDVADRWAGARRGLGRQRLGAAR